MQLIENKRNFIIVGLLLLILAGQLSGCSLAGLATMNKSNAYATIPISEDNENIIDIVCECGKEMGYTTMHRTPEMASMHYQSSMASSMFVGHTSMRSITAEHKKDKLYVNVVVHGTFGTGEDKYSQEILKEFKNKLASKLK